MMDEEINSNLNNVNRFLEQKRIKDAFDSLVFLTMKLQNWQLREDLSQLEENYKRMLSYISEGYQDPDRDRIFKDLLRALYLIKDRIGLELKTQHTSSVFYEKRRSYFYSNTESYADLIARFNEITARLELLGLIDDKGNQEMINLEREKERISHQLFYVAWLSGVWNQDVKEEWKRQIEAPLMPDTTSTLLLSAISLNLMEVFDEQKILLLLDLADHANEELKQRALTGLLLVLREYDQRLYLFPVITARLQHLAENPSFIQNIRSILLQFILSRETEKISRKIKDELIPKVMKMGPKFQNKFRLDDIMKDPTMDEKNPEWEKIIKDEGLQDQFQEISELQMEGADVMHSSFAHLKNYAFFNDLSNWFRLFDIPVDALGNKGLEDFARIMKLSTMMCNSDKYSFYFSLSQMPENYRKMMMGQFSMESSAVQEMLKEDATGSKKIGSVARQYIQDIYRFHKLYPRKKDFKDVFNARPEFYQVPSIFNLIASPDNLLILGEYYFNKNYFEEAADLFSMLLKSDPDNCVLYQKLGYCQQMMGDQEKAVETYLKAELLSANNPWIIKKLAYSYRLLKKPEEALLYYKKAEKLNPDNLSIQLNIGHCYLELKDYTEALKCYFKVEYLDKNKSKAWRPIAWCSFLTGKYDQAMDYFTKIIDHGPNATDYLNAGHTQFAMGNLKEAIAFYVLSAKHPDNTLEKFAEAFNADIPDLVQAGVNEKDIPFIFDRVLYDL